MRGIRLLAAAIIAVAVVTMLTVAVRAYATFAKWGSSPVLFYVNPANADGLSPSNVLAALQTGMDAWNAQPGSPFSFQYAGTASDTTNTYDNRNVIVFRNVNNGSTIATTYSWWSTGSGTNLLVDSDVVFWDGGFTMFTGTSGCSGGVYIEDVAAHELGHALGLGHSTFADATMYPTYNICSQSGRTPAADDIAGLEFLYPNSGPPPPPPPPPPPSGATLTATGRKVKGLQKADLRWSGLSGGTVDVYRNAIKVLTTPNDDVETDNINKKGSGSYAYRVCEAGTTAVCTNTSTVTF